MPSIEPNTVMGVLGTWGYPALLLLLIVTGLGPPIPEDLLLLTVGYLGFVEVFQWPLVLAIAAPGVIASDAMLYSAGRHLARRGGPCIGPQPTLPDTVPRVTRWLARLGSVLLGLLF